MYSLSESFLLPLSLTFLRILYLYVTLFCINHHYLIRLTFSECYNGVFICRATALNVPNLSYNFIQKSLEIKRSFITQANYPKALWLWILDIYNETTTSPRAFYASHPPLSLPTFPVPLLTVHHQIKTKMSRNNLKEMLLFMWRSLTFSKPFR